MNGRELYQLIVLGLVIAAFRSPIIKSGVSVLSIIKLSGVFALRLNRLEILKLRLWHNEHIKLHNGNPIDLIRLGVAHLLIVGNKCK